MYTKGRLNEVPRSSLLLKVGWRKVQKRARPVFGCVRRMISNSWGEPLHWEPHILGSLWGLLHVEFQAEGLPLEVPLVRIPLTLFGPITWNGGPLVKFSLYERVIFEHHNVALAFHPSILQSLVAEVCSLLGQAQLFHRGIHGRNPNPYTLQD